MERAATEKTEAVEQASRPRVASWVHWCRLGDHVFILDLKANSFLALDLPTSEAFALAQTGVSVDDEFVELFAAKGWFNEFEAATSPRALPWLGFAAPMAIAYNAFARRWLRNQGFAAALAWAIAQSCNEPRCSDPVGAFRWAETLMPHAKGDLDCLPRATGLFAYLRATGYDPVFIIGVKQYPFTAHAWVELDHSPVLEADDGATKLSRFTPILTAGHGCQDPFSSR